MEHVEDASDGFPHEGFNTSDYATFMERTEMNYGKDELHGSSSFGSSITSSRSRRPSRTAPSGSKRPNQWHVDFDGNNRAKAHRGSSASNRNYSSQSSHHGWKSAPPNLSSSIGDHLSALVLPMRSVTGLHKVMSSASMIAPATVLDPPLLYQTPPQGINAMKPESKREPVDITPEDNSTMTSLVHDTKRKLGYEAHDSPSGDQLGMRRNQSSSSLSSNVSFTNTSGSAFGATSLTIDQLMHEVNDNTNTPNNVTTTNTHEEKNRIQPPQHGQQYPIVQYTESPHDTQRHHHHNGKEPDHHQHHSHHQPQPQPQHQHQQHHHHHRDEREHEHEHEHEQQQQQQQQQQRQQHQHQQQQPQQQHQHQHQQQQPQQQHQHQRQHQHQHQQQHERQFVPMSSSNSYQHHMPDVSNTTTSRDRMVDSAGVPFIASEHDLSFQNREDDSRSFERLPLDPLANSRLTLFGEEDSNTANFTFGMPDSSVSTAHGYSTPSNLHHEIMVDTTHEAYTPPLFAKRRTEAVHSAASEHNDPCPLFYPVSPTTFANNCARTTVNQLQQQQHQQLNLVEQQHHHRRQQQNRAHVEPHLDPTLGTGSAFGATTGGGAMEKPAGKQDMGTWQANVYTPEQQGRLGVNANGLKNPQYSQLNPLQDSKASGAQEKQLQQQQQQQHHQQQRDQQQHHQQLQRVLQQHHQLLHQPQQNQQHGDSSSSLESMSSGESGMNPTLVTSNSSTMIVPKKKYLSKRSVPKERTTLSTTQLFFPPVDAASTSSDKSRVDPFKQNQRSGMAGQSIKFPPIRATSGNKRASKRSTPKASSSATSAVMTYEALINTPSPKGKRGLKGKSATLSRLPQSASKTDNFRQKPGRKSRNKSSLQLARSDYDPFLSCTKHQLCLARAKLGEDQIRHGYYHCTDPGREKNRVPKNNQPPPLEQALMEDGDPYVRSDAIEDTGNGMANLMQLHMIRALEHRSQTKRPLLNPNVNTSVTINPIHRILQSKRFYCGKFFNEDGTCQTKNCILICFPKNHRGDVRLQMKVWQKAKAGTNVEGTASASSDDMLTEVKDDIKGNISARKGGVKGNVSARKDDIKAHMLSYLCWVYGLSQQVPKELGQWPTGLHCLCDFGHKAKAQEENAEFLCINPFHYLPSSDLQEESESECIKRRAAVVMEKLGRCIKNETVVAGERPSDLPLTNLNPTENERAVLGNKSCCYCHECRTHMTDEKF